MVFANRRYRDDIDTVMRVYRLPIDYMLQIACVTAAGKLQKNTACRGDISYGQTRRSASMQISIKSKQYCADDVLHLDIGKQPDRGQQHQKDLLHHLVLERPADEQALNFVPHKILPLWK
jgi:hypothetical protein